MAQAFEDWGLNATLDDVRFGIRSWITEGCPGGMDAPALALFRWQAHHNEVYREFVRALRVNPSEVSRVVDIPFLPVEMFKSHAVKCGDWPTAHVFRSSGTSQTTRRAEHHLDAFGLQWYRWVAREAWCRMWGEDVSSNTWLGLLPGYVGREDASLLAMVSDFMDVSDGSHDGMLMNDHEGLVDRLKRWSTSLDERPLVLFGVTWAVLDWLEALRSNPQWKEDILWDRVTLVDTGGMKGRAVEPIREDVQRHIRGVLPKLRLASEYGMTEMMSQGYALDGQHHVFPPWVRPLVRELSDPRSDEIHNRNGRLDVVDLGNVQSCAFLATQDAASLAERGLVLLGRTDRSEARGCSLMATP